MPLPEPWLAWLVLCGPGSLTGTTLTLVAWLLLSISFSVGHQKAPSFLSFLDKIPPTARRIFLQMVALLCIGSHVFIAASRVHDYWFVPLRPPARPPPSLWRTIAYTVATCSNFNSVLMSGWWGRHNIEDVVGGAMIGYSCAFVAIRYYKLDFSPPTSGKYSPPGSFRRSASSNTV